MSMYLTRRDVRRCTPLVALAAALLWSCGQGTTPAPPSWQQLQESVQPHAIASVAPTFLASLPSTDQIAFVDPATEKVTEYLDMTFPPGEIVVHPTRPFAYVESPNGIIVLRLTNQKVEMTFAVPSGFSHLLVGQDGDTLYGLAGGAIVGISTATGVTVHTFSFPSPITSFAQSSLDHLIFASVPSQDEVLVIDPHTGMLVHTIVGPVCRDQKPCHPDQLVASTDGKFIAGVARKKDNGVAIFDAQTFRRVANVGSGTQLAGMNAAADQAWYVHHRRGFDEFSVVNLFPPFAQATRPFVEPMGPFFGRVAFDVTGTIGLATFSATNKTGLVDVEGSGVTILTQTTPSWIAYAH